MSNLFGSAINRLWVQYLNYIPCYRWFPVSGNQRWALIYNTVKGRLRQSSKRFSRLQLNCALTANDRKVRTV